MDTTLLDAMIASSTAIFGTVIAGLFTFIESLLPLLFPMILAALVIGFLVWLVRKGRRFR